MTTIASQPDSRNFPIGGELPVVAAMSAMDAAATIPKFTDDQIGIVES